LSEYRRGRGHRKRGFWLVDGCPVGRRREFIFDNLFELNFIGRIEGFFVLPIIECITLFHPQRSVLE